MNCQNRHCPLKFSNHFVAKICVYLCFAVYMFLIHYPLPIQGDDALISPYAGVWDIGEHFFTLLHFNGKIFTDYLAFLFFHIPYTLWKVFNTAVFVLIALLLSYLLTDNTQRDAVLSCSLIAVFPMWYLGSAGYIATSTNYLYPIAGILIIACQLKDVCCSEKVNCWRHLLSLPVVAYILNQDQAACILVGGLLLLLLYSIFLTPNKSKQVISWVAGYFAVAFIGYVIMFLLPGHLNRMNNPVEMELYLPEFANWSIWQKLLRGYASTVANVFFYDTTLSVLFCFLLFVLCHYKGSLSDRVISVLPLCGFLLISAVGNQRFIQFDNNLPDLRPLSSFGGFVGFCFSVICLFSIVYSVCKVVSIKNRWLLLGLLILGAGSRLMMGFSATLYASSYRTFTYLMFALIGCCLLILRELKNLPNQSAYCSGAAGVIISLLLK